MNDTSNGNNTGNMIVSGDVMTFTNADGSFTANRVTSDTNPIVGSWLLDDPNDPVVFTFFANGYYNGSQTCLDHETGATPEPIAGGMEFGIYAWDSGTGSLTGNVIVDTDGWCGLHSTNDVSTSINVTNITIDGDVMTITSNGEPSAAAYRIQ